MNREELITQVKEEYANIASAASQQHFHQTTTQITPAAPCDSPCRDMKKPAHVL